MLRRAPSANAASSDHRTPARSNRQAAIPSHILARLTRRSACHAQTTRSAVAAIRKGGSLQSATRIPSLAANRRGCRVVPAMVTSDERDSLPRLIGSVNAGEDLLLPTRSCLRRRVIAAER